MADEHPQRGAADSLSFLHANRCVWRGAAPEWAVQSQQAERKQRRLQQVVTLEKSEKRARLSEWSRSWLIDLRQQLVRRTERRERAARKAAEKAAAVTTKPKQTAEPRKPEPKVSVEVDPVPTRPKERDCAWHAAACKEAAELWARQLRAKLREPGQYKVALESFPFRGPDLSLMRLEEEGAARRWVQTGIGAEVKTPRKYKTAKQRVCQLAGDAKEVFLRQKQDWLRRGICKQVDGIFFGYLRNTDRRDAAIPEGHLVYMSC